MSAEDQQALADWARSAFALEEVLAIGGRFADGQSFHPFARPEFAACDDDPVWLALQAAIDTRAAAQMEAAFVVWTFESAALWLASRADGTWLGVFTQRDIGENASKALRARMESFVSS